MEKGHENILQAVREAKGIAYYGELLLERKGARIVDVASLRAESSSHSESLQPAGDVFNVMRNIDVLQKGMCGRLVNPLNQLFVGPINETDELGKILLKKFPFELSQRSMVHEGEVGLCHIDVTDSGDMAILLDSHRAAIRDALRSALYRKSVVQEAQKHGVFFTSLVALGMTRDNQDFIAMMDAVHRSGAIIAFDTNYRAYVEEECFRRTNNRHLESVVKDILPNVDIVLAGTEDLYALAFSAPREMEQVRDAFFRSVRPDAISVLKAGKEGALWRDAKGAWHPKASPSIYVRNTTGAGDAFNGGFLFGIRHGQNSEEATAFGNTVGAAVAASDDAHLTPEMAHDVIRNLP